MKYTWRNPYDPPAHNDLVLIYTGDDKSKKGVEFGYYLSEEYVKKHLEKYSFSNAEVGWFIHYDDNDFPAFEKWGNVLGWMEIPDFTE